MRILTSLEALTAATAITLLGGCSDNSAIAPKPMAPQSAGQSALWRAPAVSGRMGTLYVSSQSGRRVTSFYACPARGPIKYVADSAYSVIHIYSGIFNYRAECGQITSGSGVHDPYGLYVKTSTHDLYVANTGDNDILVFHRGQTIPYDTYTDPTVQYPVDVTVGKDGTVLASNVFGSNFERGSISTWIQGASGGTFVGNFPMLDYPDGNCITVRKNGTVYFDEYPAPNGGGLWSVSCPAGVCGAQTQVKGVSLISPWGMRFDAEDDLVVIDTATQTANTFELPNPKPSIIHLASPYPGAMAINQLDHHLFVTDDYKRSATEYLYPSGIVVGIQLVPYNGAPLGVAVDPGPPR
jgi:hypothetical protein